MSQDTLQKQTMQFDAEVGKVLQLVIHSLYTNKEIFLRELISNASDALDKLRYEAVTNDALLKKDPELKIRIYLDEEAKTITIADNGIGMSRDELIHNLGTIARSGTQNFMQQIAGKDKDALQLIGQFGVGFYSAFMVADKVTVVSRKAGEAQAFAWESAGEGNYTVAEGPGDSINRGTKITLHIREDAKEFLDKHRISHIVRVYSDHIALPIELVEKDGKAEVLNTASALWLKAKAKITEQQYEEFYHHTAHAGDKPWMVLHNKAEGAIEYTNLLFIPSVKPFDLFHPERRTRVKLYVKRVFITEENLKVIPAYLRFLRGIVDSEDLPLNISRETLQDNAILQKIKKSITKKVISELKKKASAEPDEYIKFWENFGAVFKEGLCEGMEDQGAIMEVCRFHSTNDSAKYTSMEEYISRMKEGQENIFYLIGDDYEALAENPLLEGFKQKGIEVLLLTDNVDDFWTTVVFDYKGKQLKSITRSGIDLSKIKTPEAEEKKENAAPEKDIATFIAFCKTTLGDKVKDVRTTGKLADSPACISAEEGGIDIRFEKFLAEQHQIPGRQAKVLEINPEHPVIAKLAEKLVKTGASDEIKDAVFLLLDQALVIQGENISDAGGFSRRVNRLLEGTL